VRPDQSRIAAKPVRRRQLSKCTGNGEDQMAVAVYLAATQPLRT